MLGALITTILMTAAMGRIDMPEADRKPFFMYSDEFQNYATDSFAEILSQSCKFGLHLTLAHQYLGQLPDYLRKAVFGNSGSVISLRVGSEDAELLAPHLGIQPQFETSGMGERVVSPAAQLVNLADFTAVARILRDHAVSEPHDVTLLPPAVPINSRPHRIITNSRVCFGRDRAVVQGKITRFLAS